MTEEVKKPVLSVIDGGVELSDEASLDSGTNEKLDDKPADDLSPPEPETPPQDEAPKEPSPEDLKRQRTIDFNAAAKKAQDEKRQRIMMTSFHNLKGRDMPTKLDAMFEMIRTIDKDLDAFDKNTKSQSVFMEFVLTKLDPDGSEMRKFTNEKYHLEEMKDGDILKARDFVKISMVIKAKDKELEYPRPEFSIDPEEVIQFTPFKGEDLIGVRVGESLEKNGMSIKITRGRRKMNTNIKKPLEESITPPEEEGPIDAN
jgi:hypothetical protein